MFLCKVNAALKLLSNEGSSGLVTISEEVHSTLHEKHPEAQPMFEDLLLQGPVNKIHPATFQAIDGDLIQIMAARTKGFSSPSQMVANMWHRLLLSKSFADRSTNLSKAIAKMTTIMCTERCDKENRWDMEAFLSCTLVPLSKNPGVRPIGISKVLRRIVRKSVTTVLKKDIWDASGNLQLCKLTVRWSTGWMWNCCSRHGWNIRRRHYRSNLAHGRKQLLQQHQSVYNDPQHQDHMSFTLNVCWKLL